MKYYEFIETVPKISPLVIIEGTERELAEMAMSMIEARLREAGGDLEIERYRAPAMDSFQPIAESLVALGFFRAHRCIFVRDVHELRAAPRRALWEVAQTVTAPSVLVLEERVSPTKKTKAEPLGALAPRGTLRIDTTASADVRKRYIAETVKAAGSKIEAAALRLLATGRADLGIIRTDLERLALEGVPIAVAMLAPESLGVDDPKSYIYASALVRGDDREAFRIIAELFEDDPRDAAIPLLSCLANEYGLLWELARGKSEIAAKHRWREPALRSIAQKIGARVARRGFERAIKGFEAIVTGQAEDSRLLVEAISAECAYERAAALRRR